MVLVGNFPGRAFISRNMETRKPAKSTVSRNWGLRTAIVVPVRRHDGSYVIEDSQSHYNGAQQNARLMTGGLTCCM